VIPYAGFLIILVIVAWLTAGGMAVRSASRIWLRHWAERRLRGSATVVQYLERPQRLLAAANTAIALALGFVGLWIGWRSATQEGLAMVSLGTFALVVILFGHLVPRAIGRRWPSAVLPVAMPALRVAEMAAQPLLAIGRWLARVDDAPTAEPPRAAMQDLLREGEMEGVGKHDEIAIISGVMRFGEKTVGEVMTARKDVFALPEGLDAKQVARQIAESAFSRVPVYRGSLDQVVGMYHAFDILKERSGAVPPLRPVASTPATTACNDLLFKMLRARMHLAIVQDDAGCTVGIATLENLLEELVGDIRDEHDDPAGTPAGARPGIAAAPARVPPA
jgi:putative hemolysin